MAWIPAAISGGAMLGGGLMSGLFGKENKPKTTQVPTMTGGQRTLLDQLTSQLGMPLGYGMQGLSSLLSNEPGAMEQFEAPYMRQFQEKTLPSLFERFAGGMGKGGLGGMQSSAFGQQLGGQGAGLMEILAALRGQMQQSGLHELLGFTGQGLENKATSPLYDQGGPTGFLSGIAPSMMGAGMQTMGQVPGMYAQNQQWKRQNQQWESLMKLFAPPKTK
jgi:hypothetical protein